MLKPLAIRILTIPWIAMGIALLWAVNNIPGVFAEPWQVFLMTAAFGVCLMAVITGFVVADEVKSQDAEMISLRKSLRAKK